MSYLNQFAQKEITETASTIQFFTDVGAGQGFFVNGNIISGSATTSGSVIGNSAITLNPGTATITAMTCRGVTGPSSTTPVPWTMKVSGNEVKIQIAAFTISTIGGTGSPTAVYVGPIIPVNLRPALGGGVNQPINLTNGSTEATGLIALSQSTGQIAITTQAGATLTANVGPVNDVLFSWLVSAN
jgi:hypothetical protein